MNSGSIPACIFRRILERNLFSIPQLLVSMVAHTKKYIHTTTVDIDFVVRSSAFFFEFHTNFDTHPSPSDREYSTKLFKVNKERTIEYFTRHLGGRFSLSIPLFIVRYFPLAGI
jgi:hypothetical protein